MKRVLTGIKPTGTPHIGNYVGAIRPAIAASRTAGVESFYFLADWHALVSTTDPLRVQRATLEIAATWLALGLDPDKVLFYRQSDIPEIPELTWLLTCVTGKGLLNRAHAYKAAVDANAAAGEDPDAGVTAGLYMYPVLMAADILMFNAHAVPVGRDQVQHIEIARDLAARFNHLYGGEYFTLPEAQVEESTAVLPGLDGRKMSKSYDNVIPLWATRDNLRKAIMSIVTNSQGPGEPKDPDSSHIFTIYRAFASHNEVESFRQRLMEGLSWGAAKEELFELIDVEIAPARERYVGLVADSGAIEELLERGAQRARAIAKPFLMDLRKAVGIRSLADNQIAFAAVMGARTAGQYADWAPAEFTNPFKHNDGFTFRIRYANGEKWVIADGPAEAGFSSPREAGQVLKRIRSADPGELDLRLRQVDGFYNLEIYLDNQRVARGFGLKDEEEAQNALVQLRAALRAAFEVAAEKEGTKKPPRT